jgi:hypothetical protein
MNKPAVFAEFDRSFWFGLAAWAEAQELALLKEGADATDWDGVKKAQGGRDLLKKVRKLQGEYETYLAARTIPPT